MSQLLNAMEAKKENIVQKIFVKKIKTILQFFVVNFFIDGSLNCCFHTKIVKHYLGNIADRLEANS